jgi:hypothetical protein
LAGKVFWIGVRADQPALNPPQADTKLDLTTERASFGVGAVCSGFSFSVYQLVVII